MKREKSEIYPTLKVTIEKGDENARLFKDMQVVLESVKDINTKHGEKVVATVLAGEERLQVFVNQTSMNALIDAFGDNDENWTGKIINLKKKKDKKYSQEMIVFEPVA